MPFRQSLGVEFIERRGGWGREGRRQREGGEERERKKAERKKVGVWAELVPHGTPE